MNIVYKMLQNMMISEMSEISAEKIQEALDESISIYVYGYTQGKNVLNNRIETNIYYYKPLNNKDCFELSAKISELIMNSNVANAVFVPSCCISGQQFKRIRESMGDDTFIETYYRNHVMYTQEKYITDTTGAVFGVFTLRFVKNNLDNSYRIIPLTLLPELNEEEETFVVEQAMKQFDKVTGECITNLISKLRDTSKRVYHEMVVLLSSVIVMNDFFNMNREILFKTEIEKNRHKTEVMEEAKKIAINYVYHRDNNNAINEEGIENIIQKVLNWEGANLNDFKEGIEEKLKHLNLRFINYCICEDNAERNNLSNEAEKEIIEDFIYKRKYKEELLVEHYFRDDNDRIKAGTVRFNQMPLNKSIDACIEALKAADLSGNVISINVVKRMIAYILHMMDIGVCGLHVLDEEGDDKGGLQYCLQAGEQSMAILPLRNLEYIPLLTMMEKKCEESASKLINEIREYINTYPCEDMTDPEYFSFEEIKHFIDCLYNMEQRVSDWSWNMFTYYQYNNSGQISEIMELAERRDRHVRNYITHLRKERGLT